MLNERTLPAAALPRPTSHTAFVALGVMTPATAERLGLSVTPQTLAIGGPTLSSGQADRLTKLPINQIITVKEGKGIVPRRFPKIKWK